MERAVCVNVPHGSGTIYGALKLEPTQEGNWESTRRRQKVFVEVEAAECRKQHSGNSVFLQQLHPRMHGRHKGKVQEEVKMISRCR